MQSMYNGKPFKKKNKKRDKILKSIVQESFPK